MKTKTLIVISLSSLLCLTSCIRKPSSSIDGTSSSSVISTFTVTWKNHDGTILEIDEDVLEGSVPHYDGITPVKEATEGYTYTFSGWSPETIEVKEDITYTAQFDSKAIIYLITLDSDGGELKDNTLSIAYGSTYNLPTPTKEGYSFEGWYDSDNKIENTGIWNYPSNKSLKAHWSLRTYTITYDLGGGVASNNPTTYTILDTVTLNNPTKEGYTFSGWSSDYYEGLNLTVTFSQETGNKHFIAKWTANTYTVSFDPDGGNLSETSMNIVYDSSYSLPTPTKEGYSFEGWYENETLVPQSGTWKYSAPKNLKAKWKLEYLYKGTYPQSLVTNGSLISALNTANIVTLPADGRETDREWTSFSFYKSGSISHYMWYVDTTHTDGNKYRAVFFNSYRPNDTTSSSNADNSKQDENGYDPYNVYWFRYDPIRWDVLSADENEAFVLSHNILDVSEYFHTSNEETRTVSGTDPVTGESYSETDVYENNYKYSDIRKFSNITFYNTAFSSSEKSGILTKTISNNAASGLETSNTFSCEDTSEKVFPLSMEEVTNPDYGFASNRSSLSQTRQKICTEYAKCMGLYVDDREESWKGSSRWWTRSPSKAVAYNAKQVNTDGTSGNANPVSTIIGLLPASYFSI